jgi:tetratricopeptide (TPR) repeat protein
MTTSTEHAREPAPDLEALAERLVEQLAAAWHGGQRPPAEEYLTRHPELTACPEAAVRVIYEEICLREEQGEEQASADVLARFPQWRDQLELLLDCHRLLQMPPEPDFPAAGETLEELRLLSELGRGAKGRVFLATQPALGDRPVVVKMTTCDGQEHLSLARLQHTHLVPLYWVRDVPERNLRVLCMPYLGGATLERVLEALAGRSPPACSGRDLLAALDRVQARQPAGLPGQAPARQLLGRMSGVQDFCWIGACVAEALQYAHERGLVHLDVKPSNVLLAAVQQRRPVPAAVDGRSDVYALGLLLYESLGGARPPAGKAPEPLHRLNPAVGVGLSDIVHRCLAPDARDRYATAGALAGDLRRYLEDLPLRGVANRSWTERWQKWRRRRPHAFTLTALAALAAALVLLLGAVAGAFVHQRRSDAATALQEGQQYRLARKYVEAEAAFGRGLRACAGLPGCEELARELTEQQHATQRERLAEDLHLLADQARELFDVNSLSPAACRTLEEGCRRVWDRRFDIRALRGTDLDGQLEERVQTDLLDLAVFRANLHIRTEGKEGAEQALRILGEAEAMAGPSPALALERHACALACGDLAAARATAEEVARLQPRTSWDRYALGRFHLRTGEWFKAAGELTAAADDRPQDFWPSFYQGICFYRLQRYAEAREAFRVCVTLAPERAPCYYSRALAESALGDPEAARKDYDRALERDPGLAEAALNRGILLARLKHYDDAQADFERALMHGADPAAVLFNEALVHEAQANRSAAREDLQRALQHNPAHAEARALLERLQR